MTKKKKREPRINEATAELGVAPPPPSLPAESKRSIANHRLASLATSESPATRGRATTQSRLARKKKITSPEKPEHRDSPTARRSFRVPVGAATLNRSRDESQGCGRRRSPGALISRTRAVRHSTKRIEGGFWWERMRSWRLVEQPKKNKIKYKKTTINKKTNKKKNVPLGRGSALFGDRNTVCQPNRSRLACLTLVR